VAAGYLIPQSSAAESDEPSSEDGPMVPPSPWREWGTLAWSFHNRTRDTRFVSTDPEQLEGYLTRILDQPRPSSTRPPVCDEILLLPRVRTPLNSPFRDVLEGRRTHRDFIAHELGVDAFADLLHYSFAPLRFADAGPMGVLQLRAAASGGARHETEAFVFVFSVSGVQPGLYHYDNIRHGLVPLVGDASRDQLEHLTHDQGFFRHACFGVLTVAVADRMAWKYPHPVAYKLLHHNIGHVAQVFSMTAAALGLGAALTGAIRNTEADTLLTLDQPREFTTFALACGLPILGPNAMPKAVRAASSPTADY